MGKIKPTNKEPISPQSQEFEKDFKKAMVTHDLNIQETQEKLNEIDGMLSEAEQSLKKKIFSLPKMEALVFSDPKLSAVYDEMAANGEEKYGYHYNETIQNMIFNDYVLNSPQYLQKYKMAIPKEKKRRDKSGINQLKKAGQKKIDATGTKIEDNTPKEIDETNEPLTKVLFLVNETNSPEVFAYFPDEDYDIKGRYKTGYAHVGQHTAIDPNYAKESRLAIPEEYQNLKAELEGQGYNLEVLNGMQESTTAGSAGGAAGYVGYAGPAAWSKKGDLMGNSETPKKIRKPIANIATISESNYLTDTSGFEKYVNALNEESDSDFIKNNGSNTYGSVDNMHPNDQKIIRNDIQSGKMDSNHNIKDGIALKEQNIGKITTVEQIKSLGRKLTKEDIPNLAGDALYAIAIQLANKILPLNWNDLGDINSMWDYIDENGNMTYNELMSAVKEAANDRLSEEGMGLDDLNEKAKSKKQQRFMGMVHAVQKGKLSPDEVGDSVEKAADSMSDKDAEDFASTKHKGLPNEVNEELYDKIVKIQYFDKTGQLKTLNTDEIPQENLNTTTDKPIKLTFTDGSNERVSYDEFMQVYSHNDDNKLNVKENSKYLDKKGSTPQRNDKLAFSDKNIKEDTQTMIDNNGTSMSNKAQATGDQSSEVPVGTQQTSGLNESDIKLLEELNKELEAFSIHHDKLKIMSEERKTTSQILNARVGAENEKNFKKDFKNSDTKDVIDVEKELQYQDQQTDVPDDPQKLGQDIEKQAIKNADMKSGEALKNVGNSTNNEGDEIPKRNLTTDEQDEVNLYRNGQHSLNYDNEPSERFIERQKADQGEFFEMGEKQKAFKADAPMYNKDSQPVDDGIEKVQYDKNKSGWNDREGIKESMITGRYIDILGKRRLIEFRLNEVTEVEKLDENISMELDFTGLGNTYLSKSVDKKVIVNETVVNAMNTRKFYTDGKNVVAIKNPTKPLNEGKENEEKTIVNEQVDKMKHLLGYKPDSFVNTKNVKKNRGF